MYNLCLINTGGLRQAEAWDLGPSAVILVPGQTSPIATNYKFCVCVCVCVCSHGVFATPWTVAHQAPLSMGFPRQEYKSGLPFPSSGDLPYPGIKPGSLALLEDSLPLVLHSWRIFWTTRYKKTKKKKKKKRKAQNPTATSEEPGAKPGSREQNRVLRMSLTLKTTRGGQTNEVIPLAQPLDTPLPSPHVRNQLTHTSASKQGKLLLVLAPPCYSSSPNKALPEFPDWPHQSLLIEEGQEPRSVSD